MAYKDKKSRKAFFETWKGRGYEKGETQQFWLSLLTNVLGYEHNDTVLFEHHVSTGGFIDVWIRQSDVMIEQKSIDVDLDKPEVRQGETKTPLQQVIDYAASLPLTEQPKYLITCNFDTFRVYDRNQYGDRELQGKQFEFKLEDLVEHPEYLSCIVDPSNNRLRREQEVSEQAGRLIGDLYDMLRGQYHDPDTDEAKHSLNVLCVRLVFCLFCEDAGLFGEPDAFVNYIRDVQPQNIRIQLQHLFENLDTPREQRDEYDIPIKVFPYVNGGLFREKVVIPNFTQEIKDFLLDKVALPVNWSKISPTIFGGIFESTLNPETRRKGGMHYTSPENIHKVIDPLFLDDLKAEFDAIRSDEDLSVIKRRNKYKKFHEKLCSLVFFDPACGSGNFLTETYICLKRLEYAVLKEYKSKQMSVFDSSVEGEVELRVQLDQFYGIEINDFAVSVAETALWISRLKANQEYMLLLDLDEKDFPLEDRANIICENALRFDWNDLVEPSRVSYIMGNPPFVGMRTQTEEQKEDLKAVSGIKVLKQMDYVAGWYFKANQYIKNTYIECAFVSSNSIAQGEQALTIWQPLFDDGVKINFAYRTFEWSSEAENEAHVHCVIIGFSERNRDSKFIWDGTTKNECEHIDQYLRDSEPCFITKRGKPICAAPEMTKGAQLIDGGHFVISEEEYIEIKQKKSELLPYLKQYWNAKDLLNNGNVKYAFYLENCPSSLLETNDVLRNIVNAVREYRLYDGQATTRALADRPSHYFQSQAPEGKSLVIPVVSSQRRRYIPVCFMPEGMVYTNALFYIDQATVYDLGVLESSVHMAWARKLCGRLKSDYRYSNTIVYNTFPWPTPTDDQKAVIEQTAQSILDARSLYPDKSLADLYDPDKMPAELKAAHEANDKAVMDAYGFDYDMTEPEIVAELMKMYQELTAGEKK
ncbi:MAG: DNA methyltransferase [Saccharofermentans sp.]|nr:DNA methyltransferase [Saccharofermentans sp.]